MKIQSFKLDFEINTYNKKNLVDDPEQVTVRLLRMAARDIELGNTCGSLRDPGGLMVGSWSFERVI